MVAFSKYLKNLWREKFPFKFVYSDSYWMVDLEEHVFPIKKYRLIYEKLLRSGAKKEKFISPSMPDDKALLFVHSQRYIKKIKEGKLSSSELQALEIPYSAEGIEFAFLNVGGTIEAAELAHKEGLCIHIGGGFHHAFYDHGEGFCVLNDISVALEHLKQKGDIQKAMVVDCDVHQGNGTASVLSGKEYAFTFSIHQMDLYPAIKPESSLDVGLWSGDGDEKYLELLNSTIPRIYHEYQPDLIFYLAGADPFEKDQLGGLKITMLGLKERDNIVLKNARKLRIPVVVVLAGGYAYDIDDTVTIHMNTVKVAQKVQRKYSAN